MRIFGLLVRRAVTALVGLACLTVATGIVASMSGVTIGAAVQGFDIGLHPPVGDAGWLFLGGGLVGLGLVLLVLSIWPARSLRRAIPLRLPQSPADGLEVTMAPAALLSLLRYEAFRVPGVTDLRGTVHAGRSGWEVRCKVNSRRDVPVKPLADQLDERLRAGLLLHTGVPLSSLAIDVRPTVSRARHPR